MAASSSSAISSINLEIFLKQMNAETMAKLGLCSTFTRSFVDRVQRKDLPHADTLIVMKKNLFIAKKKSIGNMSTLWRDEEKLVDELTWIKPANGIQEVLEKDLTFTNVIAIKPSTSFLNKHRAEWGKLKTSAVALRVRSCAINAFNFFIDVLKPETLEIADEKTQLATMFIHHPRLKILKSISYAPNIEMVAVPSRLKSAEFRNCSRLAKKDIRSTYVKKWLKNRGTPYFHRVWGCTKGINEDVKFAFIGIQKNILWSPELHEESFLSQMSLTKLKTLKRVFTVEKPNSSDIMLVAHTTHRLFIQTMPYGQLSSALKLLKKNPTIRDRTVRFEHDI